MNLGSREAIIHFFCRYVLGRDDSHGELTGHTKQTTQRESLMSTYFDLFRIYTEHKSIQFLIDLSIFVLQPLDVSTSSSLELHFRMW